MVSRNILIIFSIYLKIIPILTLSQCSIDSDCSYYQICNLENQCIHKNLFPILTIETIAMIIMFFVTIITTIGGIGGGVFYLPIFMIFFNFKLNEAIPLSIANVAGVLLFRYLLSIKERHPRRDKPLIHYEISMIFCPSITVGTIFGVLINRFSPTWLILFCVLIFMANNGYKTLKKAKTMKKAENLMRGKKFSNLTEHEKIYLFEIYNKIKKLENELDYEEMQDTETPIRKKISHSFHIKRIANSFEKSYSLSNLDNNMKNNKTNDGNLEIEMKLLNENEKMLEDENFMIEIEKKIKKIEEYEKIYSKGKNNEDIADNTDDDIVIPHIHDTQRKSILNIIATKLQKIIQYENQMIPWDKVKLMLLTLIILTVIYLCRGSRNFNSIIGFEYCGIGYWIMQFSFIPFGILILYYSIRILNEEYQEKLECAYIFLKNDIKWDGETCKQITINGIITGLISAILGIGGAIIIGPLLLHLGFSPAESTATASFLALFTSFSALIQYCIMGVIKWDYALILNLLGIISMYIGLKLVNHIKKMDKQSLIVYVLASLIIFSTFLIIISGISNIISDYQDGKDIFGVKKLCKP